jgi:hypothetical protein
LFLSRIDRGHGPRWNLIALLFRFCRVRLSRRLRLIELFERAAASIQVTAELLDGLPQAGSVLLDDPQGFF